MKTLTELITQHKQGNPVGIYSVCSAHPLVLEAAIRQAAHDQSPLLVEATSNQVNQDGGYTGMTPQDFVTYITKTAAGLGFNQLLLGGDHLGPNCWQHLPAEQAMAKAGQLIHDYVCAGFRKIHLDCSMSCAGDPVPLSDEVVAERAARLCDIAESAWQQSGGEAPVYVVGTEVPVPGGATEELEEELALTSPQAARHTIESHLSAFEQSGLGHVWPRVIGLVVQPGVEFDHHRVHHYDSQAAQPLARFIEQQPYMVFEAHSTDYQSQQAYQALVRDHFAILKVGPALTFAMREALFALDRIEQEWLGPRQASHLRAVLEKVMHDRPDYWRGYYRHSGHQQALDCAYSLSDRIRYYWPHPEVQAALETLIENLERQPAPVTLISQYLPGQARAITNREITAQPEALIFHKIQEVLQVYADACHGQAFAQQELTL